MKIRIIKTPPGSVAPEEIRQQWVGIEIPVLEGGESESSIWTSEQNAGGYVVDTTDAVNALRNAGRENAAAFWEVVRDSIGDKLRFRKDCCEVI